MPVPCRRRERDRVAEAEPVELERERRPAPGRRSCSRAAAPACAPRRRISASSSSPGVMPARASTTKSTRSASAIAARACAAISARDRGSVGDVDAAGVDRAGTACRSTRRRAPCGRASFPGVSCTTAARELGQPVDERRLADVREADDRDRARDLRARALISGGLASVRPSAQRAMSASQSKSVVDLALLDLRASPPCSPARSAGARSKVAARRTRSSTARSCRASSAACRRSRPGSPARPPGARPSPRPAAPRPGRRSSAASPRRTRRPSAVARRLAHQPHRLAVGLAAPDRDRPEQADELRRAPGSLMRLDLRDEVDVPRRAPGRRPGCRSSAKWLIASTRPPLCGTRSSP